MLVFFNVIYVFLSFYLTLSLFSVFRSPHALAESLYMFLTHSRPLSISHSLLSSRVRKTVWFSKRQKHHTVHIKLSHCVKSNHSIKVNYTMSSMTSRRRLKGCGTTHYGLQGRTIKIGTKLVQNIQQLYWNSINALP